MSNAERILVCVGPSPFSAELVRATHRMAEDLHAPWVAASVVHPTAAALPGGARLDENLRLAESLGAEISRHIGTNVGEGIMHVARQRHVTRIIVGKPPRSPLRSLFRRSVVDELIRLSGDTDVFVVSGDKGHAPAPWRPAASSARSPARYLWAAAAVGVTTALSSVVAPLLGLEAIVMLYLLAIMVVALRLFRGPAFFAAALSVAAFDFFFAPPSFTFAVKDPRHFLTFAVMFAVGLVISSLTVRIRREEASARAREERTRILYEIGRELGASTNEATAAEIATRRIAEATGTSVALFAARSDGKPVELGRHGVAFEPPREATSDASIERAVHGALEGRIPPADEGRAVRVFPVAIAGDVRFAFAIVPRPDHMLADAERALVETVARPIATEIERIRLAAEADKARLLARTEELRSALLSAVSHDLRTPLATITGAATRLRDDPGVADPIERSPLVDSICDEAERLERLLGNLLDMTRLQAGGLVVKREWVPIEEVIGSALTRLETKLGARPIEVVVPDDAPLVAIDPVLFAQVFVNLLENAIKYTPAGSPLEIRVAEGHRALEVEVADRGPGIPAGDEAKLFEKFVRGRHAGVGGVGLGLAICRGIVEAHGGTISAANREAGGASFVVRVPQDGSAPELSAEPLPASGRVEGSAA